MLVETDGSEIEIFVDGSDADLDAIKPTPADTGTDGSVIDASEIEIFMDGTARDAETPADPLKPAALSPPAGDVGALEPLCEEFWNDA